MNIGTFMEKEKEWKEIFEKVDKYKGNSAMIFVGGNRTYRKPTLTEKDAKEIYELKQNGTLTDLVIHASYLGNLSTIDNDIREKTINMIVSELKNAEMIGVSKVCIHPGAYTNTNLDDALNRLIINIKEILKRTPNNKVKLLVETMSGKGTEVFTQINQWKKVIDDVNINYPNRIGICLDTCHNSDSGYSLLNESAVDDFIDLLKENDLIKYIYCIHLNGSLNPVGSHKDRHCQLIDPETNVPFNSIKYMLKKDVWNNNLSAIIECVKNEEDGIKMCNDLVNEINNF